MRSRAGYGIIAFTLLVAAVLAIVPNPLWLQWARPEWVALVILYWCMALPHRVGLLTAAVTGVFQDVLEGAPLGQHGLALLAVALLVALLYKRLRVFSLWQQSAMVFLIIGMHQLIDQWVQSLQGAAAGSLLFLLPALTSALVWPVVLHVLRALRRYYHMV
ncbi:MAG: rod shape-determining protein MreD [Haliea sp.]|nr:rod shape-determining protein MreD [Haliea sp.]|tara:strand:+ start:24106 stop:24588 length:483 start_codon:yes stop_codon:yes gene_type:complete